MLQRVNQFTMHQTKAPPAKHNFTTYITYIIATGGSAIIETLCHRLMCL
jgi:hypothetical protein